MSHMADFPASFAQTRLWFMQALAPRDTSYVAASALVLRGALDVDALVRALDLVVDRHEPLRTVIVSDDGRPTQRIQPPRRTSLVPIAVTSEAEADRSARALATRPIDLAHGPLFDAHLLALGPDHHWLVMVMHHVVTDRWSREILLSELARAYDALRAGHPPALPELPVQYADFAVWQAAWLDSAEAQRSIEFWRQTLSGAPRPVGVPPDLRPSEGSDRPSIGLRRVLARGDDLASFSRARKMTPFSAVLAAWAVVLHRATGQRDLVIGCPSAGRTRAELEPLIGCFVNILPLRLDLSSGASFTSVARRASAVAAQALAHQDYPFDKIVEILRPPREPGQVPYFRTVLAYQSVAGGGARFSDLDATFREVDGESAKFDLTVSVLGIGRELELGIEADGSRYTPGLARAILEDFVAALETLLDAPETTIDGSRAEPLFAFEERAS